jgi:drug/metabolite transporter (DMT)-like permease
MVSRMPDAIRGALWMLFSAVCYVASATLMRSIGDSYSAFELTFIRAIVAVIMLGPIFLKGLRGNLMPERPFAHLMVGVFSYVGILAWVYAAARMPVADFFALQFVTPLCTITLAILFLRERTDRTSWICALVGFAGVLIILRPGLIAISVSALVALISSLGYATVNTIVKSLSNKVSATAIVFYANFLLVPISLPLALYDWKTPLLADMPEILGVCVLSTIGYVTVTKAITLAPARVVQPVNFMRMPIAAGFGFVFFSELPDFWTWIGAFVIFLATSFAVQRGARQ